MAESSQSGDSSEAGQTAPFTSLLAVSSLVLAVLLVAGVSYRWAYFYNFGLKELALQVPTQSVAISALELIRNPTNAFFSFCIVVAPLLVLNGVFSLIDRTRIASGVGRLLGGLGMRNRLVRDTFRAIVLIYSAFWAGSQSGWQQFQLAVTETSSNPLPKVAAVVLAEGERNQLPFGCKPTDWDKLDGKQEPMPPIIGDPAAISALRNGLACDIRDNQSWRMLYRDDKFLFFATSRGLARPLTLVLHNTNRVILIMGASRATVP